MAKTSATTVAVVNATTVTINVDTPKANDSLTLQSMLLQ